MPDVNKRLAFLEQAVRSGSADAFAYYGLGMEYRKLGRVDEGLATFVALREREPDYQPMYLMVGQMLTEADRRREAVEWIEAGIALARSRGDGHALGELETALHEANG
jgi:tetratricopeptide (TPR) repeat protein